MVDHSDLYLSAHEDLSWVG